MTLPSDCIINKFKKIKDKQKKNPNKSKIY